MEKGAIGLYTRIIALVVVMLLNPLVGMAQDVGSVRLDTLAQQVRRTFIIAKSACLVLSGSTVQAHSEIAYIEAAEFTDVLEGLINGDAERGVEAEQDAVLRSELEAVQLYALGLTVSVLQVVSGDFHTVPVAIVLNRNKDIAHQLENALVAAIPKYTPKGQKVEITNAIQLLHSQRALIEELMRDLCYARGGLGPRTLGAEMLEKMSKFEMINTALINGEIALGLAKAPNINIKIGLGQVASKWHSLRALLEDSVQGEDQDVRDVELASLIGDTLSQKIKSLITLYEKT